MFPNATSLPSYRPRVDRVERYRTGWLNVAVAVLFIVGDPGGMGKTDVSPINPGRVEPIRITAEGEAAMDGAVRVRSEEKDRCIVSQLFAGSGVKEAFDGQTLFSDTNTIMASEDDYSSEDDGDDDVVVAEVVGGSEEEEEEDDDEVDDEIVEEEDDEDEEDDDDGAGSFGTDITPPHTADDHAPSSSSKKRTLSDFSEVADDDDTAETGGSAVASATTEGGGGTKKKSRHGRPPKLHQGLTIPFRTIKRIMKTDVAVGNIQNDAAIMVTAALEHFVKEIALKSLEAAKHKRDGTNIVKYEDVATARANNSAFSFLDLLIP